LAVPLFFMISGAIMLGKEEEPIKVLWKKRILKFAIILITISLLYYIYKLNINLEEFNIKTFLFKFLTSKGLYYHLGFLYSYIAYLISLPFLKSLVKNLKDKHYYYMIGISLLFTGIIPIIEYLIGNKTNLLINNIKASWIYSEIVIYPCIGYFLHNKFKFNNPQKVILISWILNIVSIIISCYMTLYKGKITGTFSVTNSQTFHRVFVLINSICVFITIKYIFEHISVYKWIEKLIYSLGGCTFGIYLLHPLLKKITIVEQILSIIKSTGINRMIAVFIWCLCILIISYIVTWILKKIPILKNLVGG